MYSAFKNVLCPLNKRHSMASTEPLILVAKNSEVAKSGGNNASLPVYTGKLQKKRFITKDNNWCQRNHYIENN